MQTVRDANARLLLGVALRHGPEAALTARFATIAAAQRSPRRIGIALTVLFRLARVAGGAVAKVGHIRQNG